MERTINTKLRFIILPILGGILYATSFPTTFLPLNFFGTILGLSLYLYAHPQNQEELKSISLKIQLRSVLLFCLSANLLAYYWIPNTIKVFGNIHPPFNYALGLFFTLIVLPQLIVYTFIYRVFLKLKYKFPTPIFKNKQSFFLIMSFLLCLAEIYTPQQFPTHSGHSWMVMAPRLLLAPLFGASIYSLINIYLSFNLASFFTNKKIPITSIVIFLIFLLMNISSKLKKGTKDIQTNNIRIVQANIGNFLKIDSEHGLGHALDEVIKKYELLSLKPYRGKIDLMIWPETAYPHLMQSALLKDMPDLIPSFFKDLIQETQTDILTGGYDYSPNNNKNRYFESEYNAAFHFKSDLSFGGVYRKIKLIPFGESLPFGKFNSVLARYIQNISYFASGKNYPLFQTQKNTNFMTTICYEILFSDSIRKYLNKTKGIPRFMVNLTNDSWYGDTSEPYQHLYLAKWRALEFNIPIIRSTNTGITSVLYPDGSESKRLNIYQKGNLDLSIDFPKRSPTLFEKWGITGLCLFFFLLLIFLNVIPLLKGREDE